MNDEDARRNKNNSHDPLTVLHGDELPVQPDPAFAATRAFYLARGFTPLFESDRLWGPGNPALVLVKAL